MQNIREVVHETKMSLYGALYLTHADSVSFYLVYVQQNN